MNVDDIRKDDKNVYTDDYKKKIGELIIDVLLNDEKTVPYPALRYKLIKRLRDDDDRTFITDSFLSDILGDLIKQGMVGISGTHRYYVDYLDWPTRDDVCHKGIFKLNNQSGSGLICKCEKPSDKHQATHFVHIKNFIEGLKNNSFVEFVELDISAKKSQQARKSRYVDAKILRIIPKEEYCKEITETHLHLQQGKELENQKAIKGMEEKPTESEHVSDHGGAHVDSDFHHEDQHHDHHDHRDEEEANEHYEDMDLPK